MTPNTFKNIKELLEAFSFSRTPIKDWQAFYHATHATFGKLSLHFKTHSHFLLKEELPSPALKILININLKNIETIVQEK